MTVTLIGSRAIKAWYPDFRDVSDSDWDYHSENHWQHPSYFFHKPEEGARIDVFRDERIGQWPSWVDIANPNELYTMKISHSFWEINGPRDWDKHAADIVFLERKGARFLRPLYDILLPIWKERYKKNPTNLNQSAGDFFKDGVHRIYDHDSIHETVAYNERPLFESLLLPDSEVRVDTEKFLAMPHDTQLQVIREEIYATALERILIPKDYMGSPGAAYRWALRRTATSLLKGEWALFLMLNLDTLGRPDVDYVGKHKANLHKLRPHGGTHD